jgi:hypothetical protein
VAEHVDICTTKIINLPTKRIKWGKWKNMRTKERQSTQIDGYEFVGSKSGEMAKLSISGTTNPLYLPLENSNAHL